MCFVAGFYLPNSHQVPQQQHTLCRRMRPQTAGKYAIMFSQPLDLNIGIYIVAMITGLYSRNHRTVLLDPGPLLHSRIEPKRCCRFGPERRPAQISQIGSPQEETPDQYSGRQQLFRLRLPQISPLKAWRQALSIYALAPSRHVYRAVTGEMRGGGAERAGISSRKMSSILRVWFWTLYSPLRGV
jgi:hypothetical protein